MSSSKQCDHLIVCLLKSCPKVELQSFDHLALQDQAPFLQMESYSETVPEESK